MKDEKEKNTPKEKSLVVIPEQTPLVKNAESDIQSFLTIVQCLNEGLEDDRLETDKGAVWAMFELKDFYAIQGKCVQVVINEERKKDGLAKVWFEV